MLGWVQMFTLAGQYVNFCQSFFDEMVKYLNCLKIVCIYWMASNFDSTVLAAVVVDVLFHK